MDIMSLEEFYCYKKILEYGLCMFDFFFRYYLFYFNILVIKYFFFNKIFGFIIF